MSNLLLLFSKKKDVATYDFMTDGTLPSGASLTRSTTGTYIDSSGVVQTSAINSARFSYLYDGTSWALGGLLVEPLSTNRVINSGSFSGFIAQNTTLATNIGTAPDGTSTLASITQTTASGVHLLASLTSTPIGNSAVSTWLKAGNGCRYIQLMAIQNPGAGRFTCIVDLQNGTITDSAFSGAVFLSAHVTSFSNGLYRVDWVGTTTLSDIYWEIIFAQYPLFSQNTLTTAGQCTFTGDGTTTCYVWGPQFENGTRRTSYIPTGSSVVTRAADQLMLDIPNRGTTLRLTFDDASTQDINVTAYAGATYTIDPTTLNRYHIRQAVIM